MDRTYAVGEQAGRYQRNVRATRLLELLLPPKGKALFEDVDPCCWCRSCKLVVEDFQDAILLSDNSLNCPPCVQCRSAMVLASGEEYCDCRKQIGQRAGVLWTLGRRRIRRLWLPGRGRPRCECCCLAYQTTCELGPGAEGKSLVA